MGTLNAVGMLLVVLMTAIVILRYGQWPERLGSALLASLGSALGVYTLATILSTHLCRSGQPIVQQTVASFCLGCVLFFVHQPRHVRLITGAVIGAMAVILAMHFSTIVHTPGFTGNPAGMRQVTLTIRRSNLAAINDTLAVMGEKDHAVYPAGWVTESPEFTRLGIDRYLTVTVYSSTPEWHTWLTGIYQNTREQQHLWYPGGTPTDAAGKMEYRWRGRRTAR